ncbi:unnamed protein product [Porites evermanni]|uniref:Uncharacterized protein n=1 Tax=Porites evermanni TaxID=104178 RepID=A0ABN8MDE9_9CNID|nr:unnamed protein product [Porites evermanni]
MNLLPDAMSRSIPPETTSAGQSSVRGSGAGYGIDGNSLKGNFMLYSTSVPRDSPGWKAAVSVAYCVSCSEVAIPNARTKQATIPVKDSNPLSRNAQQRNNQCADNLMAVKGNVLL